MTATGKPMDAVAFFIGVAAIMYGTYSAEAHERRFTVGGPCLTPKGQLGTCSSIDSCDTLRLIVSQRPIPPKDQDYLRNSQCIITHSIKPYVCCPDPRGINVSFTGGLTGENLMSVASDPAKHPNFRLLSTHLCGSDLNEKIYNGEEANLGDYPWIAAMEYQTKKGLKVWCGGALINDRYILTAAHCVKGIGDNRLVAIRLGEHNLKTDPDCVTTLSGKICANHVQIFIPAEIVVHPEYIARSVEQYHDIALVRLNRSVNFTNYIVPICLPGGKALTKRYYGKKMIAAGWGSTENGTSSNVKRWVKIPVMSHIECQIRYQKQHRLNDNQMCAGGVNGKDSCQGDSGGPLMTIDSVIKNRPGGQWVLAGVVSIGPGVCGVVGSPGVYTRVGPYVNWILDNLKP